MMSISIGMGPFPDVPTVYGPGSAYYLSPFASCVLRPCEPARLNKTPSIGCPPTGRCGDAIFCFCEFECAMLRNLHSGV
jgi:hypothetical protein